VRAAPEVSPAKLCCPSRAARPADAGTRSRRTMQPQPLHDVAPRRGHHCVSKFRRLNCLFSRGRLRRCEEGLQQHGAVDADDK
jgi:hypothetical protein